MTTEAAEAKKKRTISAEQQAVQEWWKALQDNKGGRAELRRAKELEQIFFLPEFYNLYNKA